MRVLVLGAGGQLGSELLIACGAADDDVRGRTRAEVDLTDQDAVESAIRSAAPELVFNAAAYTAVDRAEAEPDLAMTVNGEAPGWIAAACRAAGARLVHFSTDYVFDGTATAPIPEEAPPRPLGIYGRTKRAGEEAVLSSGADAMIVRTSWVYGLTGANFVRTVLRVTRDTGAMRVVDDQRGSPTWARDVASASRRLADHGAPGMYHLTNSGDCTWYELAVEVARVAGVDATITPIGTADYPTPAPRPAYSVLANNAWARLGFAPLRDWRTAVGEMVPLLLGKEAADAG